MDDLTKTLDAIDSELASLLPVETTPTVETVSLTPDEFIKLVTDHVAMTKAEIAAEEDPSARIEYIKQLVSLAKAYKWEETGSLPAPVFSGELSCKAQSAYAERIAEHPGKGMGAPGPQASPGAGAFERPMGTPSGPASNTASPAQSAMPPAFPVSPAATAEGFISKAATVLAKADNGDVLLAELTAMLNEEAQPGDGDAPTTVTKDNGWPLDLATKTFLDGEVSISNEDDFGTDPTGLSRGKLLD